MELDLSHSKILELEFERTQAVARRVCELNVKERTAALALARRCRDRPSTFLAMAGVTLGEFCTIEALMQSETNTNTNTKRNLNVRVLKKPHTKRIKKGKHLT